MNILLTVGWFVALGVVMMGIMILVVKLAQIICEEEQ